MIGIVVVSHSAALAEAAIALAVEMVPVGSRPVVLPAGGLGDGRGDGPDDRGFGTDATRVASAIAEADSGDGVLVLVDLGSAVLSAEMALEFCDPAVAARVLVSPAPLVEGLVTAVVAAASGAGLAQCDAQARRGLAAKEEHLVGSLPRPDTHPCHAGDAGVSPVDVTRLSVAPEADEPSVAPTADEPTGDAPTADEPTADALTWSTTLDLPHGLHARPAASVAVALAGLDATVTARNPRTGATADAASAVELMGLDVREGDTLEATITGTDAAAARSVLERAAADRFGELR